MNLSVIICQVIRRRSLQGGVLFKIKMCAVSCLSTDGSRMRYYHPTIMVSNEGS